MSAAEIAALPYRPCVGLVLMNRRGEIFAGKRIDNPGDAWQMPQGGVEKDEAPRDAALRELGEETGVVSADVEMLAETAGWIPYDLPFDLVPKLWKGRFRGQEQKWFLLRFHGEDSSVRIDGDDAEFSTWGWMPPKVLIERIVPFKRAVYDAVFAEFAGKIGPG
ncbi:MAG: RNA pyrophosphohydrolase [Paracoccaceae bacterium]